MKKLFLFAAAALALASCSETDELALNQAVQQQAEKGGIQFDVYTQRSITRAGAPGGLAEGNYGLTTKSLKEGTHSEYGFGVFAYYTSNSEYDTNSSIPNFMYNQQVVWDQRPTDFGGKGEEGKPVWTYEPVKYWPNEFGNGAESDDFDHVTFFAYAPWVDFTVNTGIPVVNDGEKADSVQKKNIVGTIKNSASGDPYIKYIVDTDPATSVDLLWGVAAELNGYEGINKGAVTPGCCYLDLTKQIGTRDSVKWNFKHALAQLNIQIIQAVDTETEGSEIYEPAGENAIAISTNADGSVDHKTKVYLRWIEFNGFSMKGALNLHSEDVESVADAKPNWKGFDGTNELTYEPVRFYDGLKDGKEGTTNNIQKNESPLGLNPMLIEESTDQGQDKWSIKKDGIPYAAYANLFASKDEKGDLISPDAADPIYVIPNDEELTIEMLYDVQTEDEDLAGVLSDAKTHGSAIENKISKATGVTIEAGKSYIIKIVVGMESVKFSVEVTDWVDNDPKETDVDLPYNPGYKLVGSYYSYGDEDLTFDSFQGTINLFEKLFPNEEEDEDEASTDFLYFGYDANKGIFTKRIEKPADGAAVATGEEIAVKTTDDGENWEDDEPIFLATEKTPEPEEEDPQPLDPQP